MRMFITGGAGFIGSNYVRHLLALTDVQITVYDTFTYAGLTSNLSDLRGSARLKVVRGDVCDSSAVRRAMAGHDIVVHFAAETNVDRSLLDPDRFFRTNQVGTATVAHAAATLLVERFIHVSTDEVYGSNAGKPSAEGDPLRPTSPYARSKAACEEPVRKAHEEHGLDTVIARCSNAYGPYQYPEKMVPLFITMALDGDRIPLYGDGLHVRDWLAVADLCAAIDLLVDRGASGGVYNIAAGNERTSLEVTTRILGLLGMGGDRIEHVADRPGHDRRYSLDSGLVRALGWAPVAIFEDELQDVVRWYVEHERWWRPLIPEVRRFRRALSLRDPVDSIVEGDMSDAWKVVQPPAV